jgi:hypothetical protein
VINIEAQTDETARHRCDCIYEQQSRRLVTHWRKAARESDGKVLYIVSALIASVAVSTIVLLVMHYRV